MQIKATEITLVPLKDIKLNPKNRNKHSKEQIDRLAKVIMYQGFREPGVISKLSGNLAAGEGRYLASKQLGLTAMPCIFQDFDDEDQEYAFGVSTNAISAWAELDMAAINTDMSFLDGATFDIELLGIKDFVLEPADFEVDPKQDPKDKGHEMKKCPSCGVLIE